MNGPGTWDNIAFTLFMGLLYTPVALLLCWVKDKVAR